MFNDLVTSCLSITELKSDQKQAKKALKSQINQIVQNPECVDLDHYGQLKDAKNEKRWRKRQAKASLNILIFIFANFSFKFNMLV